VVREGQASLDRTRNVCPSHVRGKSIFQRDCWDTQLRWGERYHEKWEYMRNNPVRKGLAACADAWPYGGVMHELVW
jgi:hypothetical protein